MAGDGPTGGFAQAREMAQQALYAARVSAARQEKALHIAQSLELRACCGGGNPSTRLLAEARRLRQEAAEQAEDARRFAEVGQQLRA